jgi:hypothetical protein
VAIRGDTLSNSIRGLIIALRIGWRIFEREKYGLQLC